MTPYTGHQAAAIVGPDIPKAAPKRELTPKQLAELRRTMPAFRELEGRTLRSRGVNTWWCKP